MATENNLISRQQRARLLRHARRHAWWVYGLFLLFGLVLTWNVAGNDNANTLSISITVLEIFLVVFAVGGFWLIRSNAREAARDEARETAERIAREIAEPAAYRAASEWLDRNRRDGDGDVSTYQRMFDSLDGNEEGSDDR